jgi:hypothetical protein
MKMNASKLVWALAAAAAIAGVPQARAQSTVAKLQQVTGNVLVSREAGLATGAEAQEIANGSRIITTANSRVVVVFDNGCRVEMQENQRLEVDSRKPCAALVVEGLALAQPALAIPLANYIVPGVLLGAPLVDDVVRGGGAVVTTLTPVSPN